MIDINLYISKLLFTNSRVVVSELGVFIIETQEAYKHPVSNDLSPKYKKIKFEKDFDINDDALSKSILDENAVELIRNFVIDVKDKLDKEGHYKLQNIGTLKLKTSGAIIFEQDLTFNYEKSFFGLQALNVAPMTKVKESVVVEMANDNNKPKKKIAWLWISISAAIIFVILFIAFKDYIFPKRNINIATKQISTVDLDSSKQYSSDDSIVVDTDTLISTVSHNNKVQDTLEDVDTSQTIAESESDKIEVVEHKPTKKYYVIAGCFRSEQKAQEYLQEIKNNGYSDASIEGKTNGGLIRVCYAGFDKHSKAKAFMLEASKKESKTLWIQKIIK